MTQTYRLTTLAMAGLVLAGTMVGRAAPPTAKTRPGSAADAARIKRGEYLVNIASCHDCHTPFAMTPKGPQPDMARALSGHPQGLVMPPPPAPVGPWIGHSGATNTAWAGPWGVSFTANLTPDNETGLGKWTESTFIQTIRTGRHMGRGRPILPPMPIPMYKHFTDADLEAIFSYLRTIPAVKNRVPEPVAPAK